MQHPVRSFRHSLSYPRRLTPTQGSFCYIGPQGIVHGTTITILSAMRKRLAAAAAASNGGCKGGSGVSQADRGESSLRGLVYLSSGLGGMSGAQPKAAKIAGCVGVIAEVDGTALRKRHAQGWLDEIETDVHACIARIRVARAHSECVSIGFHGNVVLLWEALAQTDEVLVDLGSDQTSLHNPFLGERAVACVHFVLLRCMHSTVACVHILCTLLPRSALLLGGGALPIDAEPPCHECPPPPTGGYYPVGLSFEEARVMMREDPPRFQSLVQVVTLALI